MMSLWSIIRSLDKNIFSKYQSEFRAHYALLIMIEKMNTARDKKEFCAAILTDLSKAFELSNHLSESHEINFCFSTK